MAFDRKTVDAFGLSHSRISGVCIIPRFVSPSGEVRIGVVFENKFGNEPGKEDEARFGFPFGGINPNDATIIDTANRELREELLREDAHARIEVVRDDFIGKFPIKNDNGLLPMWFVTFSPVVPADTEVRPGPDQQHAFKVSPHEVDDFVHKGFFFPNHAKAWTEFREKILSTSQALS